MPSSLSPPPPPLLLLLLLLLSRSSYPRVRVFLKLHLDLIKFLWFLDLFWVLQRQRDGWDELWNSGVQNSLPGVFTPQPTLVVLYPFFLSPLLWLISEWTEDLLPFPFPHGSSRSRGPGPCTSLLAHLGLSPDLLFVLCHWRLFAFPAANGQFSVNHNCFTPLGRIIKIGWWACWLSTQRSWQLSWALP